MPQLQKQGFGGERLRSPASAAEEMLIKGSGLSLTAVGGFPMLLGGCGWIWKHTISLNKEKVAKKSLWMRTRAQAG